MGRTKEILTARTTTIEGLDMGMGLWKRLCQSSALMLVMWVALQPAAADAQTCGTPGKDGPGGALSGIKNTYYPGAASIPAGTDVQMSLGVSRGATTPIDIGDLLLVIQMQDASINTANTNAYGANNATGIGYTAANNSGRYEYIRATNAVPLTGGLLSFVGTGTNSRLLNAYTNSSWTAVPQAAQHRFQVVRVPQYTTATLTSALTASPWDGTSGGVLALDVSGILTPGGTVSVDGLGFRPGAGRQLSSGGGTNADYRSVATLGSHGQKGEGIAGTPRYVFTGGAVVDTGVEGYPNGSMARGAPANAGGGGTDGHVSGTAPFNDENSGGGGGGNWGVGGRGGNTWTSQNTTGGLGGARFAQAAANAVVMGGGGGAGTRNNSDLLVAAASGGAGGGIVMLRIGNIIGTGTITANGAAAFNGTLNDGGGGGGGGGSIVIWVETGTLLGLTLSANGGRGGDAWNTEPANGNPGERHGPGGGGGGGVLLLSAAATATSVAGGVHGVTTTSSSTFGSVNGAVGLLSTTLTAALIPGVSSGATCTLAASAVGLESFQAARYDGRVGLEWETGYEVDNLGFNIYREENGQRQLVNKSLIAGSALLTKPGATLTGRTYSCWDVSTNASAQYWLEDVDLDGTTTWHGPIVAIDAPYGQAQPLMERTESILIDKIGADTGGDTNATVPVGSTFKPAKVTASLLYAQASAAAQAAAKISVKQEGWYRVTQQELAAAGFTVTSPQNLQLLVGGVQQPFILNQPKGGDFSVEFYGIGADTTWSDSRVYWLVVGAGPGAKIRPVQESPMTFASSSFPYTVERSDRTFFFSALKNGEADNFFGPPVTPAGRDWALTLRNIDGVAKDATIEVRLQGFTLLPHRVSVILNGISLGEVTYNGQDQGLGKFTVSQALLREGENHVVLTAQGGSSDLSLVVSVRVTYWHRYQADDNSLRVGANGKEQVTIEGFTSGDIRVVDVTSPNAPQELTGTVSKQDSSYSVTVTAPGTGKRSLLAFSGSTVKGAASIKADRPSSLRQKGSGADLVIITTQALLGSVEPLRELRQSQGLKVSVVDVEDIYDEFSFGDKSAQAIKDFLSYARTNWSPAPRFVLLAGDATFDPRNYTGAGAADLVPTKLVETVQMETASDDWFADSNLDGLAEMAVGRLPVRTAAEAAVVIGKIVAYDSQPASGSALLVNDRNDTYNFQQATQTLKSLVGVATVEQVDRNLIDDAQGRSAVTAAVNRGQKIVNYIGHGSVSIWAGNLMTGPDANSFTNSTGLSMFVLSTCLNGLFHDSSNNSLAERLLQNPRGGAVAVWASSGYTEAEGQSKMNQELMRYLFSGKASTIGEAVMNAKGGTGDMDVRRTWVLLGDPSTKLR